jgi:LysR family transcriptional regulator, glycine cleavage system transcriptional activator
MKRARLPLTALRSFESAGRLLSFSKAAEELFVSQAAISRQVRELEDLLEVKLFERLHRRVELTTDGKQLLNQLTASFDEIDRTLSDIRNDKPQSLITISAEPTFAGLWLLPQLEKFRALHPDIDISVDADHRLTDFRTGTADIAIRHSLQDETWPRVEARLLQPAAFTPILSHKLNQQRPLRTPADALHHTLLHEENRDMWSRWFERAGLPQTNPSRGPIFPDGAFAANAAKLGHGIALGDPSLLALEIQKGELLAPFSVTVPFGSYWLVAPNLRRLRKPVKAFADWLLAEVSKPIT